MVIRFLFAAGVALLALGACMDQPDPNDPLGRTPSQIEADRAQCAAQGGEFRPAGIGILTCVLTTGDGGQSCSRATDCEGVCVADPDTGLGACSSARPIFGCFTMLDESGEAVDICVD